MATNTQELENQKSPKIRFPGFKSSWGEKGAGDIFENHSNKNHSGDLPLLAVTQNDGVVYRANIKLKINSSEAGIKNYKIIEPGDFVISLRSFQGGIEYSYLRGISSPAYTVLRSKIPINNHFFKILFKRKRFINKLNSLIYGIRDGKQISFSEFRTLKLPFPSLPEQQKIADFIESIDRWIKNLRSQKESLESYKKGMMQKIFSQEIRFKDNKGNDFPEWKEKKLSEIGITYCGLSGKHSEDFGKGEFYITYKQIFDSSFIDIKKFGLVEININEKQNKTQYGDIFFTTSSETPKEVGFSSILLDRNVSPYLNSFSFGFRPNSLKELFPHFAQFFFRSSLFRKKVIKLAQGSTRYNLSKTEFMKIKFLCPTLLEQKKIGNFLTSIDNVVEFKKQQINQAEQWKKGLMQGLFM